MPHKAPLVYSVIRLKSPGLSRHSQTSTISPVKGITAMRPANVGNLRPTPAQKPITHTLINSLIANRIPTVPASPRAKHRKSATDAKQSHI